MNGLAHLKINSISTRQPKSSEEAAISVVEVAKLFSARIVSPLDC